MTERATVNVTGIVQGVGFRPFVYRVAMENSLSGYVLNLGDAGVRIVVEGNRKQINALLNQLQSNLPSISRINTLETIWSEAENSFSGFVIEKSSVARNEDAKLVVPPDIAVCSKCIEDLNNPNSRWYDYPFTSCAACGPRFSTITDLPYDRPNTTMSDFPLCNVCNTGYTDPLDRRYHAQTTACEECGPRYRLYNQDEQEIRTSNPIKRVAELLSDGAILALEGIAGTHLVTKTSSPEPIRILRNRKKRSQRPFAIMMDSVQTIMENLAPTQEELNLLTLWRRPIILVRKRADIVNRSDGVSHVLPSSVFEEISPGLDTVGVMLPYAPLHHLLFNYSNEPALVMTSANPSDIPMYIDPTSITSELSGIADYFLIHNRRIYQRADDSVIKFIDSQSPVFIRRARGYVPEPIELHGASRFHRVLTVGPEEKATASILKSGSLYVTQHIGDTDQVESMEFLSEAINHMMHLVGVNQFDAIACDLHPEFLSTEFAESFASENNIPLIRVQHHHAHLAALIADNELPYDTRIACITVDGYGYAPDGNGWGGEILVGGFEDYEKQGGLRSVELPGGNLSARYAVRSLIGILGGDTKIDDLLPLVDGVKISNNVDVTEEGIRILIETIKSDINVLRSSSAGRFLDAASLALGICSENSYDGECPMKLESIVRETSLRIEPRFIDINGLTYLDTKHGMNQILDFRKAGVSIPEIAYAAQWYLGSALADIASEFALKNDLQFVGISGGVALNRIVVKAVKSCVSVNNLKLLIHRRIPPGDGGISFGQAAIAASHLQS
ncbi:MAG: carbamoyltransferase HypF [Candidatus Thorarchaeota archaeon]